MTRRALRLLAVGVVLLGIVAWYAPASAFNYGRIATRSVTAPVVSDQSAMVAASTDSCTWSKLNIGAQTCQVRFYDNATTSMTIGASLQANSLVMGSSFTMDSSSPVSGTATSATKAKGEWAYLNITWASNPCALGCTMWSNWQINGTASSNALATHQDHWNLTITIS